MGRVVHGALRNSVWQFSRRIPVSVKNVCDGITSLVTAKVSPNNLCITLSEANFKLSHMQLTAVTFGCSTQGSIIKGPTELVTTMVLLFCAATARISWSPSCHAVRFCLSPALPSTDVTLRNVIFKHEARLIWVTHLARIGINENNSSLYANDRIACLVEVPVIEIPEHARLVNPGTCLNGFIRL